ncbi:MAG: transcriptional repressor [Actinobacteria bacterium]|nr:transcriptional repressor [Actinomycetota bacterium]
MPRRAVIDALSRAEGHPTVEQITADIAERWPGIHLTTVYRTLETLAEVGVVTHVHLASGTAYHLADSAGGMPAHVHAQCRTCHRVIDLPDDVLDDVRRRLDRSAGFRLDPHHVALSGLCRDCAEPGVEDS